MKEQGVEHPEEHVLTQYRMSDDINRIPIPLDAEDGYLVGVAALYPEDQLEEGMPIPQVGGVVGTVKAIFRAFGFAKPKEQVEEEIPISRTVARKKRGAGLYER